jgi:hypothetical protein
MLIAVAIAVSMHFIVSAQTSTIQSAIGQNVSIVAGIKDQFIGDMFKQRQNEAVSCVFSVNPDQQIFAYNDYRTVDLAFDSQVGTPSTIQRSLFAKLFTPFRKSRPRASVEEEASAQAWIGLSLTDNGTDYYTGLHPGSPFSPPVPGDLELATYQFQAASDPVFAPTPTHCLMAGIAFTPGGLSVGFVSRFTSVNNSETRSNVHFDFSKVLMASPAKPGLPIQASDFFVDKPYIAAGANGKVVAAFVLFDESDPTKLSSKVVVFTSNNYGETWTKIPLVVSQPLSRNQAPWILIDPNNENNVYIGWRVFANPKYPTLTNAIVGKRSSNGGASFEPIVPYPVALLLRPYDVPQTEYPVSPITPRSNAYPTAVIDSHGTISVFIQEYVDPATGYPLSPFAPLSNGKARITQTNSYDRGVTWTLRRAFDYGPGSGPQFMPTAAVTGVPGPTCPGKTGPRSRIAVMYYDARPSYPNGSVFVGGGGARFDVRVAQADPCYTDAGRRPTFSPSQQVSRYTVDGTPSHRIVKTPGYGYPAVNAAYRMFNSTKSFFTGDYIHISAKISYVLTGSPPAWKPTTAASVNPSSLPAPVFKGVWADTRDIILPTVPSVGASPATPGFVDMLPWDHYLPPHSGLNPAYCENGGSRDQNPYAAEISDGLYAAAPVTFRDSTGPRAFPVYVENRTAAKRFFRLTIDPNPAVKASFNLPTPGFTPDKTADVAIGTFSTVTGSVIVEANFTGPVLITIQEIVAISGGLTTPNGLMTSLTLNTAGEATGTGGQTESRAPSVGSTPIVTKPFGTIPSTGITIGPNGPNPYVNPFGENPFGENPFGENPFGENPFGENTFAQNTTVYDVIDVTFTAENQGTKSASFAAILNVLNFATLKANGYKFQALINRTSPVPGLNGCQTMEKQQPIQISNIKTPFGENPFGENPFGENPFGENPFGENAVPDENASNSTLYLAPTSASSPDFHGGRPHDLGTYTLRVFQTIPFASLPSVVRFNPNQVTLAVVSHVPDVVPQPGSGFDFERTPEGRPVRKVSAAGAAVPTQLAFTGQPSSTTQGAAISPAIVVTVRDVFGNTVPNYNFAVTLTIGNNPWGGALSGTTTRNALNGAATFLGLTIDKAGNGYTLIATATNLPPSTSAPFDVIALPPPVLASCVPSSSLSVLIHGNDVSSYVPKGSWSSPTTATGIFRVRIEGTAAAPISLSTPSVVNSCASNSATGQTVCTANNTDVYLLNGSESASVPLSSPLTSGGRGLASFTGGFCTNCGVAINPVTKQAVIALSTPVAGSLTTNTPGFQFLDLETNTFGLPIASPSGNVSENILIDAVNNRVLSPSEPLFAGGGGGYEVFDVATGTFFENTLFGPREFDSAALDCTTGIALASIEFTNQLFIADLNQAPFASGSPGTWGSAQTQQIQTFPEFDDLAAGTSGIAVAPGSHIGLVAGEFGGTSAFGAIQLPLTSGPGSGTPAVSDWVKCYVPDTPSGPWNMGLDPHTMTAYTSPSTGHAMGLMANYGASYLAVIDLTQMLTVPRVASHVCDPSTDLVVAGVVRFISTQPPPVIIP